MTALAGWIRSRTMFFWLVVACVGVTAVLALSGGGSSAKSAEPVAASPAPKVTAIPAENEPDALTPAPLNPPQTEAVKVAEAGLPLYLNYATGTQPAAAVVTALSPYFGRVCMVTTVRDLQGARPSQSAEHIEVLPDSYIESSDNNGDLVIVNLRFTGVAANRTQLLRDTTFYVQVANVAGDRKISGLAPIAAGLNAIGCGERR